VKTTPHDPTLDCPVCHEVLNASTDLTSDRTPEPGNVTLCIYCGSVLIYGDGLRLRQTWDPEILDHPHVVLMVDVWKLTRGID
jgi:hypothetical protein